ncbi:hypothetical protein Tco_0414543 [Tanacetum coccineum]
MVSVLSFLSIDYTLPLREKADSELLSRDLLVPPNNQYDLASENKKIDLINPSCPSLSKILREILKRHPLCFTLIASALVSWIYIQQVWHTLKLDDSNKKFVFFVDAEEITFSLNDLRTLFQLPQETDNNHAEFEEPHTLTMMLAFLNELGYANRIRLAGQFVTTDLPQPWQTLRKILVRCLSTREIESWESKRLNQPCHRFENDEVVKSSFNSWRKGLGMRILEWMLMEEMKQTKNYKVNKCSIEVYYYQGFRGEATKPKSPILTAEQIDLDSLDEAPRISIATGRSNPEINQLAIKLGEEYVFVIRRSSVIRTFLTGFPAQSVRSSNADALDSLYLLVSLYWTPQSRLPH